jgi:hypothetical protein
VRPSLLKGGVGGMCKGGRVERDIGERRRAAGCQKRRKRGRGDLGFAGIYVGWGI